MATFDVSSAQKQFKSSVLLGFKQGLETDLTQFCSTEMNAQGSKYTFTRLGKGSGSTSDVDIYASGYVGTGGELSGIDVEMEQIIEHDFIKKNKIASYNFSPEAAYLKDFKNAIKNGVNAKIVTAALASTNAGTIPSTDIDEPAFEEIVTEVAFMTSLADENPDYPANVAVVMNRADYAKLFKVTKFTSSDYATQLGTGKNGIGGAQIIVSEACPAKKIIVLAKNGVGFAKWNGLDEAKIKEIDGKNGFLVEAGTSGAAAVLDNDAVKVISLT